MSEEEQRDLIGRKRSDRAKITEKTPLQQMNHRLNIGIAIVSALIVMVTLFILNNRPEQIETPTADEQPVKQSQQSERPQEMEPPTDEQVADQDNEQHTIGQSADANVIEVWTNSSWTAYETKQTGAHTSAFEKGHIDYEEKLAAAFSVIPLVQETSIVTSARNNGDEQSARIVMTNYEKTENYRVMIQWIDGEGWLPISVDVLYTADGVR